MDDFFLSILLLQLKIKTLQDENESILFFRSGRLTNLSLNLLKFLAYGFEESLKVLFLLVELCQLLLNSTILISVMIEMSFTKILNKIIYSSSCIL